jgi:hypothetical protein
MVFQLGLVLALSVLLLLKRGADRGSGRGVSRVRLTGVPSRAEQSRA